jgi:hypothetical protein
LGDKAKRRRCTKSALIREALDRYMNSPEESKERLERFRAAVEEAAGIAPYLPDGATYVAKLRALDLKRQRMLEKRWRG